MFSSDIKESIQTIMVTAERFAQSSDIEVQKQALKLLNKALNMLREEM